MWVKLKSRKNIEVAGVMQRHVRGDWVDVGKQQANLWISNNEAEAIQFNAASFDSDGDAGILIVAHHDVGSSVISDLEGPAIAVEFGKPRLPWTKTLIWDPAVSLPKRWLLTGMVLLDNWEVCVSLLPYEKLANTFGDEADQERTLALIHDLRVPVYNPAFLFVRKTEQTEYLMDCWDEERVDGGSRELSLLRAVFRAKPFILALPCTWTDPKAVVDD